ncbi:MAG: hypothetical protein GQE15_12155 [Archangiaceae bacterium]|nr:hypothetical protein [Archangiaceae bacterium]
MHPSIDKWLLLVSSTIFVGSLGFFLAAHAGFLFVMVDMLVASIIWN